MTELDDIKARAAELRRRYWSPPYPMSLPATKVLADLDRAIAIAEELIEQRNQWYSAWRSDEPVIDQLTQERDQARAEVEKQLAHLLSWEGWFVKIVDSFISQGAERKQARDDVLKLRRLCESLAEVMRTAIIEKKDPGVTRLTELLEETQRVFVGTESYEQYR